MHRQWTHACRAAGCALLLSLFATVAHAEVFRAGEVQVEQPWSQELPPNAPTVAVYFVIRNQSMNGEQLVAADTPIAGQAQLHQHLSQDGMMKMQQLQAVTIPPSGRAVFAPMAFHVMLLDIRDRSVLLEGQHFPLTLHFANAGAMTVQVEVLRQAPAAESSTQHEGH